MGDAINMDAQATNYRSDAATARANGIAQRAQAFSNAYKLESDSAAQNHIESDNMMTMRRNQMANIATMRASNGSSGFANIDSKLKAEQSVAESFEMAIANMAKSAAVSDQNARFQANAYRRQGDTALNLSNIQADYLNRIASINNKYSKWVLVGSALSQLGNLSMGLNWGGSSSNNDSSGSNSNSSSSSSGSSSSNS